jgi:hypothetical protein
MTSHNYYWDRWRLAPDIESVGGTKSSQNLSFWVESRRSARMEGNQCLWYQNGYTMSLDLSGAFRPLMEMVFRLFSNSSESSNLFVLLVILWPMAEHKTIEAIQDGLVPGSGSGARRVASVMALACYRVASSHTTRNPTSWTACDGS